MSAHIYNQIYHTLNISIIVANQGTYFSILLKFTYWNAYIPEHEYTTKGIRMESEVLKELKLIRADLNYIKKNMVVRDMILTEDEEKILDEALRNGKTKTLSEVMKARRAA